MQRVGGLSAELGLTAATLLALLRFVDEGFVNVRDDTTPGNRSLDECVKFFVTTNGQLQMPGCDALHLEILASVAGQFEYFGGQIFEDGRRVHGGRGPHTMSVMNRLLEEAMDTSHGELQSRLGRTRLWGLFGGWGFAALAPLATFSSFARLVVR